MIVEGKEGTENLLAGVYWHPLAPDDTRWCPMVSVGARWYVGMSSTAP